MPSGSSRRATCAAASRSAAVAASASAWRRARLGAGRAAPRCADAGERSACHRDHKRDDCSGPRVHDPERHRRDGEQRGGCRRGAEQRRTCRRRPGGAATAAAAAWVDLSRASSAALRRRLQRRKRRVVERAGVEPALVEFARERRRHAGLDVLRRRVDGDRLQRLPARERAPPIPRRVRAGTRRRRRTRRGAPPRRRRGRARRAPAAAGRAARRRAGCGRAARARRGRPPVAPLARCGSRRARATRAIECSAARSSSACATSASRLACRLRSGALTVARFVPTYSTIARSSRPIAPIAASSRGPPSSARASDEPMASARDPSMRVVPWRAHVALTNTSSGMPRCARPGEAVRPVAVSAVTSLPLRSYTRTLLGSRSNSRCTSNFAPVRERIRQAGRVRGAEPRPPGVSLAADAVERRDDRGGERRLAGLVRPVDHDESGLERKRAAGEFAEAVDLERDQPHGAISLPSNAATQ